MPLTEQNGTQRLTDALTKDGSSKSLQNENSKFEDLMKRMQGSKISNTTLREEVFNILLDDATESPESGKYYTFEYDPKFADKLKEWDEYPGRSGCVLRLTERPTSPQQQT